MPCNCENINYKGANCEDANYENALRVDVATTSSALSGQSDGDNRIDGD